MQGKSIGNAGEIYAANLLQGKGYIILEHSYKTRLGEIDLIAKDNQTLVFCEVKTRASLKRGHPLEAVNSHKQKQISKVALQYLKQHKLFKNTVRFDAIGLIMDEELNVLECKHIMHAFELNKNLG